MSRTNIHLGSSVATLAVVMVLALIINAIVGSALHRGHAGDMSDAAVNERIAPVAKLNTGAPIVPAAPAAAAAPAPAQAATARTGEQVFNSFCQACHIAGVAGAPKFGNAAEWAPRIAQGMDALMNSAMNGKNAMPPKGTCGDCSKDELKGAVEYMVSKSQ